MVGCVSAVAQVGDGRRRIVVRLVSSIARIAVRICVLWIAHRCSKARRRSKQEKLCSGKDQAAPGELERKKDLNETEDWPPWLFFQEGLEFRQKSFIRFFVVCLCSSKKTRVLFVYVRGPLWCSRYFGYSRYCVFVPVLFVVRWQGAGRVETGQGSTCAAMKGHSWGKQGSFRPMAGVVVYQTRRDSTTARDCARNNNKTV